MKKNYITLLLLLFSISIYANIGNNSGYKYTSLHIEHLFVNYLIDIDDNTVLDSNIKSSEFNQEAGNNLFAAFAIINCPSDIPVNTDAGLCSAVVNYTPPDTDDNITFVMVLTSGPGTSSGSAFTVGTTTVTFEEQFIIGGAVNSTCSFNVTVVDNEVPVLTEAADQDVNLNGSCEILIPDVTGSATDNCAGTTITQSPLAGNLVSAVHNGTVNVTVTATDAAGLTDIDTVVLTAKDNTAPTAVCQNITIALDPVFGTASITEAQIDLGSTDNCGTANLSLDITVFDCSDVGTPVTVTLTVNDGNGNSSTCNATVTVTDASTSASVSISTPNTIVCDAASTTFTATPGGTYGTPVYQWQVNGGNVGSNSNTYTDATLVNADVVTVIMTSNLFACGITSNSIIMTVNPTVPVSVTIQATATTICDGDSVIFSESLIFNGGVSPSYDWWLNGVSTGTTTPTYTMTPTNGDSVHVVITPSADVQCPDIPTAQSASIPITVNPLPIVSASSNSAVCIDDDIDLSANFMAGGASTSAVSWSWTGPNSFTSNQQNPTRPTAIAAYAGTYTVEVTDNNGCVNTATTDVIINPLPIVTASSNSAVCIDDDIDLSANFMAGGASTSAVSWSWTGPNSFTSNQQNPTRPTAIAAYAGTYTVEVIDNNGCVNTATTDVIINPLPIVTASSNSAVCIDDDIDLSANFMAGGASTSAVSWSWTGPNSFTSNQQNPTRPTAIAAYAGTYTVEVTDNNGCVNTATTDVIINPLPMVTASSNSAVCIDDDIDLSANFMAGGASTSAVSWSWTGPNSFTSNQQNPTRPTAIAAYAGTYTVEVTDNNGCVNTATTDVIINPLPMVTASSNSAVCIDDDIDLSANFMAGGASTSAVSWSWTGPNSFTSNQQNPTRPTAIAAYAGTYTVEVIDNNGCVNTANTDVIINPLLTPGVTITSDTTQICMGGTVNFNVDVTTNGGSSPAYQWYLDQTPGVTPVGSNSTTYSASGLNDGDEVYVVMTPDNDVCVNAINATSDAIPISVFTSPADPVFDSINSTPTAICPVLNDATFSVVFDGNITSYTWTVPTGFTITAGQGTDEITVNISALAADGDITVYATNPCGNSANIIDIPVTIGTFAAADAGPDQTVCDGTTEIELDGSVGGAIKRHQHWDWTDNYAIDPYTNNGTFVSPNKLDSDYIFPPGFNPGDTITITLFTIDPGGGCGAATDEMIITMRHDPTATISLSGSSPICEGSSSEVTFNATGYENSDLIITYNINGGGNQTINLTTDASGGNNDGSVSQVLNTGNLTSTTTYNLVSVAYTSSPVCSQNVSGSATITVNPLPTLDPIPDQTICSGDTASVSAILGGSVSAGTWTRSGSGSFNNANLLNAIYTPSAGDIAIGSVDLTFTTTNATSPCNEVSDTMTLTINPLPTLDPIPDQTICSGDTASVSAILGGSVSAGTWTRSGSGSFNNANLLNAIYTPSAGDIAIGSVDLTFTTTNATSPCNEVSDTMTLTINPLPTLDPIPDQTICSGDTASVSAILGGSVSAGTWTRSGSGSFNNANLLNAIYTPSAGDIASGSVNLTFTTTNATSPCNEVSDTMTLTINPLPTLDPIPDQTICSGDTASVSAILGGSVSAGTWTRSGSGSFNNANLLNAIYTPSAGDIAIGSVDLTFTTTNATSPCNEVSDTMTLTINPLPTLDPIPDQTICSGDTASVSAILGGSVSAGTWTRSGSGSFNNANLLNAIYTPSAGDIASGSVNLTFTTTNATSPCNEVSDTMTLTIKDPAIITTQPQNVGVCVTESANLSVVAVGDDLTFQWYKGNSPGGTAVSGATSNVLSFGSTALSDAGTYYVIISGDASCGDLTSNEVTLNVNQVINITLQPVSQTLCEGSNVTFNVAATGSISGYQWRKDGIDIVGATSTSYTINNITTPADDADYDVVITSPNATCTEAYSAIAVLTVNAYPTIDAGLDQTICSSDTATMNASIGGSADTGTWSSSSGNTDFSDNSTTAIYIPNATDISNGTVTLTYTTTNAASPCPNVNDFLILTIDPLPVASISYSSAAYCESDTVSYAVSLTGSNNSGGSYSVLPSSGLNINLANGTITPNTSTVGNYTVSYTVPASSVCPEVIATFDVEIEEQPDASFSYDSTDYCSNGADPMIFITEIGGTFSSNPAGLVINAGSGLIDLSASPIGTYTVYYTFGAVANGCGQVQESQIITIDPDLSGAILEGFAYDQLTPPQPGPVSDQIIACHEGDGTLTLQIDASYAPYVVRWEYVVSGGSWTTVPGTNAGSLTYNFTGLIGVTGYRAVINTGAGCGLVYSDGAYVSVIPPDLKPEPVTATPTEFCLGTTSTFTSSTSYGAELLNQEGGFDQGQLNTNDPDGWLVDGELGKLSASANSENPNNWSVTNDQKTFFGITYDNDLVSPPTNEGKFGIANGYYNVTGVGGHPVIYDPITGNRITTLETPIFSLLTLQDATLDFREAYSLLPGSMCYTDESLTTQEMAPDAEAIIEISLDGGVTYTEFLRPTITATAQTPANYEDFADVSLDLSDYFGQTDVRIRFTFVRNCSSSWAIDGISLPGSVNPSTVEWTDQFDVFISNQNTINWTPVTPGFQIFTVTTFINGCKSLVPEGSEDVFLWVDFPYAGQDQTLTGACGASAFLHAYDNTKKALENYVEMLTDGSWVPGLFTLPVNASVDYDGTGASGEWSITSGPVVPGIDWATEDPANYFFPSITDPTAEFAGPSGQFELTWTVHGLGGDCTDSVIINITSCSTLDFDGIDDNVTFRNDFDLDNNPFSIGIWVKPNSETHDDLGNPAGPNDPIQTILSKRDATALTDGYDLRLEGNIISFNWNGGGSISASPLGTNRWYHVGVTYDGGTYRLYIDGIEISNSGGGDAAPINNNFECIMGAMDQAAGGGNPTPVNYFSGWLDELRIWNVALSPAQLRHMMNQEIEDSGGNARGSIVPIDIPGLTWANLDGYWQMNQATDIVGGYVLATAGTRDGQMRNIVTWQDETAPLPYTSVRNGNWNNTTVATPWTYGDTVWDYPNSTGINGADIDWNIVVSTHDITSNTQDVTVLGLLVNANELTITDQGGAQDETSAGTGLWVTHYLNLDGVIDLIGESQLVQKRYTPSQFNGSILDVDSSGYLERDQQGNVNFYNYNYFSSPVNPVNTTANNTPYSVNSVLMDGTDSAFPLDLQWTNSYDGFPSTPITISRRWIWAYENYVFNTYGEWSYKAETQTLDVGLGFTMKGSGAATTYQNYTFNGKPNNATINNPINANSNSLVGNPYASSIDAKEFIRDNIPGGNPGTTASIDGTLYFWEHYPTNFTHILVQYQGGYATYNLSGGLGAVTAPLLTEDGFVISGEGISTLTPEQFIPVGQGFFVSTGGGVSGIETGGGIISFHNDQRFFQREVVTGPANDGSQFLRSNNSNSKPPDNNNDEDNIIKRIRLDFESPEGATRQILLAFVPNNQATDGFDYGYDAKFYDTNTPNYMAWMIDDEPYVIQGVGDFDKAKQYPLAINLVTSGKTHIALASLENFESHKNVYVYDSLLGTYTKINNRRFTMDIDAGEYLNRFFITFTKAQNKLDLEEVAIENVIVNYLSNSNEIYIHAPDAINVKQVYLINLLGQTVRSWNITNIPSISNNEFKIPVKNLSEGNYIIKVETETSTINKKVIVTQ